VIEKARREIALWAFSIFRHKGDALMKNKKEEKKKEGKKHGKKK